MPTFQEFLEFDLRVGTVLTARRHPTARNPSIVLEIDFGDAGVKKSSAQLTKRYTPDNLVGRQTVAVLNFPPRRSAGVTSEVLVLGASLPGGDVVLLDVANTVPNGARIG